MTDYFKKLKPNNEVVVNLAKAISEDEPLMKEQNTVTVPFSEVLSAAYNLYERPFRYDLNGQMIFDGANNLVVDVRGWGRIEKMDNGMELHDTIGEIIAEALNEKWSRD